MVRVPKFKIFSKVTPSKKDKGILLVSTPKGWTWIGRKFQSSRTKAGLPYGRKMKIIK